MQLERAVQKLLRIYQALQEASGCGLMGVVRDVLAREAYSPLPQQPPDPASGERLVAFVGEWYVQTVVRDSANIGITFSLSRWGSHKRLPSSPRKKVWPKTPQSCLHQLLLMDPCIKSLQYRGQPTVVR